MDTQPLPPLPPQEPNTSEVVVPAEGSKPEVSIAKETAKQEAMGKAALADIHDLHSTPELQAAVQKARDAIDPNKKAA